MGKIGCVLKSILIYSWAPPAYKGTSTRTGERHYFQTIAFALLEYFIYPHTPATECFLYFYYQDMFEYTKILSCCMIRSYLFHNSKFSLSTSQPAQELGERKPSLIKTKAANMANCHKM